MKLAGDVLIWLHWKLVSLTDLESLDATVLILGGCILLAFLSGVIGGWLVASRGRS